MDHTTREQIPDPFAAALAAAGVEVSASAAISDIPGDRRPSLIERAAVLVSGKVYSVPRPGRHDNIARCLYVYGAHLDLEGEVQGFLTNRGEFLTRRTAKAVAMHAGQIVRTVNPDELFSEEMW